MKIILSIICLNFLIGCSNNSRKFDKVLVTIILNSHINNTFSYLDSTYTEKNFIEQIVDFVKLDNNYYQVIIDSISYNNFSEVWNKYYPTSNDKWQLLMKINNKVNDNFEYYDCTFSFGNHNLLKHKMIFGDNKKIADISIQAAMAMNSAINEYKNYHENVLTEDSPPIVNKKQIVYCVFPSNIRVIERKDNYEVEMNGRNFNSPDRAILDGGFTVIVGKSTYEIIDSYWGFGD